MKLAPFHSHRWAFIAISVLKLTSSSISAMKSPTNKIEADETNLQEPQRQQHSNPNQPIPMDEAQNHFFHKTLRDIVQQFSSSMLSLNDPLFFSWNRFPSLLTKNEHSMPSFSSWDTFSSSSSMTPGTLPSPFIWNRWSPKYELIHDEKSFLIKVDVPGFHFHEINVELEAGGRVLCITGKKEEQQKQEAGEKQQNEAVSKDFTSGAKEGKEGRPEKYPESHTESSSDGTQTSISVRSIRSFQQRFTLDPSIDSSKISANLDMDSGLLTVRAPRKQMELEDNKHIIPITQFDEEAWEKFIAED